MKNTNITTEETVKLLMQPAYKDSNAAHAAVVALVLAYLDTKPDAMKDGDEQLIVPPFLPALEYLTGAGKNDLEDAYTRVSRACSEWQGLNKHLQTILDPILSFTHWESLSIAQLHKLCAALCKCREEMDAATYGQFIQEAILSLPDAYLGTPQSLCAIVEKLVTSYRAKSGGKRVYDAFCLSGSLLVPFGKTEGMEVCGEEVNVYNAALARLKMRILGHDESVIHLSDAITHPTFTRGCRLEQFDFVVSHLPFGTIRNVWALENDKYKRFDEELPAARNIGEWPFLIHMLAQAKEAHGTVMAIVSQATLFRTDRAAKSIRQHMSENNMLEAVVLLPGGTLLPYTAVPPVLLVLRKGRTCRHVRFVDAGRMGTKDKRLVRLSPHDVERICYLALSQEDEPGVARSVSLDEIAAQSYIWDVGRYITRSVQMQEKVDPTQLAEDIHRLRAAIADKQARLDALLAEWENARQLPNTRRRK